MRKLSLILLLVVAGCGSGYSTRPVIPHPELGTQALLVPQGTIIGEYQTPDDGIFMTLKVFVEVVQRTQIYEDLPEVPRKIVPDANSE